MEAETKTEEQQEASAINPATLTLLFGTAAAMLAALHLIRKIGRWIICYNCIYKKIHSTK